MENCSGIFGKWFGHKYEPVFDGESTCTVTPEAIREVLSSCVPAQVVDNQLAIIIQTMANCKTTYIHDVCSRCGSVVKREG